MVQNQKPSLFYFSGNCVLWLELRCWFRSWVGIFIFTSSFLNKYLGFMGKVSHKILGEVFSEEDKLPSDLVI